MTVCNDLLEVLKVWKQATQFSAPEDWLFASPAQLGILPWFYPQVWKVFQKAAKESGIGKLGTHSLRHTYRTWLDSTGYVDWRPTEADASRRHQNNMNIYGECYDRGYAAGARKGCADGSTEEAVNGTEKRHGLMLSY